MYTIIPSVTIGPHLRSSVMRTNKSSAVFMGRGVQGDAGTLTMALMN